MNLRDFIPKKKIRALVGVRVISVQGTKEVILAQYCGHPSFCPEVNTELVLEPIIEDREVLIWE